MPFTFSHPAVVLPFLRYHRYFSATGLIVGTITPDFEYFLKMRISSECSHTYLGLFYFDLPIGFLICILLHGLIRDKFIENSPNFIQKRLIRWHGIEWMSQLRNRWFVVLISILIGAFSHIFWDEFTHFDGYFVADNSVFHKEISLLGLQMPLYKYLQHGSSLVGAFILTYCFLNLQKNSMKFQPKISYWVILLSILILTLTVRFWFSDWQIGIGNIVVSFISACMLGILLASIFSVSSNSNERHNQKKY